MGDLTIERYYLILLVSFISTVGWVGFGIGLLYTGYAGFTGGPVLTALGITVLLLVIGIVFALIENTQV